MYEIIRTFPAKNIRTDTQTACRDAEEFYWVVEDLPEDKEDTEA